MDWGKHDGIFQVADQATGEVVTDGMGYPVEYYYRGQAEKEVERMNGLRLRRHEVVPPRRAPDEKSAAPCEAAPDARLVPSER